MSSVLRFFKWAIGIVVVSVLLGAIAIAGVLFWAYENPHDAFQIAEKYFLPKDLKITWKNVAFDGQHLGGFNFLFDVAIDDLHVVKKSPNIDFPIDRVHVRASVFPRSRSIKVHLVEAIAKSNLIFQSDSKSPPTAEKSPFQRVQSVLKLLETIHDRSPIEELNVDASKFILKSNSGADLEMAIKLREEVSKPIDATFSMRLPGETSFEIGAVARLDFAKMRTTNPFLIGQLRLRGRGVTTTQQIEFASSNYATTLLSSGQVLYTRGKLTLKIDPKLSADFTSDETKLRLAGDVAGIPGPLKKIDGIKIDLSAPLEEGKTWSEKPSTFTIKAPLELFFLDKAQRAHLEKSCACALPKRLNAQAVGKIWFNAFLAKFEPNHTVAPAVEAEIKIDKISNKIFDLALGGGIKISLESDSGAVKKYNFIPSIDCTFDVHSFLQLKPVLDANRILIPAPIDVLDGEVRFRARGPVATTPRGSEFPANLEVDLNSKGQAVRGSAYATVELNQKFNEAHIDVNAKIISLILDLPPLRPLDGLPRVAMDSRFIKEPVKKVVVPKFKLSFNFQLQTTAPDSIHLKAEYFQPYIPLALNLQAANGSDNMGYVSLQPFDITYLRRIVHVETLVINLNGDEDSAYPMKGRFRVKQTDYTVFIDVEGDTKSPNITFSSEPYLSKDEIISVLLYDRTASQLEAGDAETSGGVQAAIADKAIGLFGLWAFASTPIKSFSYNPATKVYTATVAVSDDVTAGIGTGWETATRLELRKRVSKRWSLTAAWSPATQEESAVSKLVLQWEKRF